MRFFGRAMAGLAMLAVTLGLLAYAGIILRDALEARRAQPPVARAVRERVYAVNVVAIKPAEMVPELEVFGEVRARRSFDLRAPRSGRVIAVAAGLAEGVSVKEGAVLVRLDPADAQAAVDLARADLRRAEADLDEARRAVLLAREDLAVAERQAVLRAAALARQRDLRDRGAGSEAAVEQAELAAVGADQALVSRRQALAQTEARADQAELTLSRLAITLAEAERALDDTTLTAGLAGVLSDLAVVEGGVVSAGERLAQIVDPAALEVALRLTTAQTARLLDPDGVLLPLPMRVSQDVAGFALEATGRLARLAPQAGAGQAGRLVLAELDEPAGFQPGDFVTARIAEPPLARVAALPSAALGAGDRVLVVGPEDRLEEVPVAVLRRQGDTVLISAAPLEGREVVAERTALLGPGIRVRPVRDGEGPTEGATRDHVALTPEHRARLILAVEENARLPAPVRARLLAQLAQDRVPAELVARLEARGGG